MTGIEVLTNALAPLLSAGRLRLVGENAGSCLFDAPGLWIYVAKGSTAQASAVVARKGSDERLYHMDAIGPSIGNGKELPYRASFEEFAQFLNTHLTDIEALFAGPISSTDPFVDKGLTKAYLRHYFPAIRQAESAGGNGSGAPP